LKLPEPFTFFIDRALGAHRLAAALREGGHTVEVHDDHFPQDTPDVDWIRVVGEQGWVLLTKDAAIRRNELERRALVAAKVAAFMLGNGQLAAADMARAFLDAVPRIHKVLRRYEPTTVATVTRSGGVSLLYANATWHSPPKAIK
jgi:hypothetical protein